LQQTYIKTDSYLQQKFTTKVWLVKMEVMLL
jgi:hypothetical protein